MKLVSSSKPISAICVPCQSSTDRPVELQVRELDLAGAQPAPLARTEVRRAAKPRIKSFLALVASRPYRDHRPMNGECIYEILMTGVEINLFRPARSRTVRASAAQPFR